MEKTIQIIHSSGGSSGGGGAAVGILVTTDAGASVSVACEGQDTQTLTATDGAALFEDLAFGTWTVTVSLGGATTTETVEIYENIPCNLPVGVRLKDMPIGSKIRLGSGNTPFEILELNHSGYPDNSVTLWTEILQRTSFGSSIDYRNSTLKSLCTNLYNTFSEREKEFVLLTDLPTAVTNTKTVVNIQDYVFALSAKELGANGSYCADDGVKFNKFTLGTNSSTTRVRNEASGSLYYYWTRSAFGNSSYSNVWGVGSDGNMGNNLPSNSNGFVADWKFFNRIYLQVHIIILDIFIFRLSSS